MKSETPDSMDAFADDNTISQINGFRFDTVIPGHAVLIYGWTGVTGKYRLTDAILSDASDLH